MASNLPGGMLNVQEFNAEAVLQKWVTAWEQGKLQETLRNHWSQFVPLVYTLKSDVDPSREERKARRLLFRPMEAFICGGDPDAILRELKEKDEPPQVCGQVFKMGEPTYSCRDCGMDPTCVLCITCFQNSIHNTHRYKMSTSGGGGYCDCGDVEAWKTEPFCKVHKRGLNRKDSKEPIESLPPEIRARAEALFICVMRYAVELLTWTDCDTLPAGLQGELNNDKYCTMLFNDEVHTYEQVINTLQRAISCTHKEAVDYATTVDREGRSCVMLSTISQCERAKTVTERQTSRHGHKPLKVRVMHMTVVGHQMFSQKILSWIQQVVANSDGLRQLFCLLSMRTLDGEATSLVEKMMLADTQLWKSSRILSHQLFMAGVLVDQECKKQFSILFTKIYPTLMKAFIDDDHDHSVCAVAESVQIYTVPTLCYAGLMLDFVQDDHLRQVSATSCSVQIFTVPTLARMLITEHNLLQVILSAFLAQCQGKKKEDGKFVFERNERNQSFRRAQYMLYDLKYALTCIPTPEEWTPALRTNFLKGFGSLLDLLKCMQGMDMVQRETGQHIEFEPEWEGAFNLQLKLADNIAIIQQWCATDERVLKSAFYMTLDALHSCRSETLKHEHGCVNGRRVNCLKYDISSQKVSIHLPITRLLAGLYTFMAKFDIKLSDLHSSNHPVSPVELMEPSLRVQVMIAQSQAGMWRRNGYSLLNQIYFYRNVRCQTEMYDKDVVMLQAAAALIDPNDYLIHILNKFGLLNWARDDYDIVKLNPQEDLLRQVITLAENCLDLLIILLGERFVVGIGQVTTKDVVRREVVHQLCIQPMPHSQLTKALPEDYNHETGIEDVVLDVASFNKPPGSDRGMYELKPEFYSMYNPYFYHYVRAEQSKSEETQLNRKKAAGHDMALAPPRPPPLTRGFQPVRHLLDCDIMMYLIRLILTRSSAQRSRSWSELQFEKVLILIGLALHEEWRSHQEEDQSFQFLEKSQRGDRPLSEILEGFVGHSNITHDSTKFLLAWVIKNLREIRQLRHGHSTMECSVEADTAKDTAKQEAVRKKRADMAAKRRARIMAQMSKMQKDFIKENSELFENTSTQLQSTETEMDVSSRMPPGDGEDTAIALGLHRSVAYGTGTVRQTCILCQEEQDISHSNRAMVLVAFIQKSTVLSRDRGKVITDSECHDPMFMGSSRRQGVHLGSCGHVMHADCWQRFYDAIVARERRRTLRFRPNFSYDIEKFEFLCPLCETLGNTVIPLLPHLASLVTSSKPGLELTLNDWLDGIQKTVTASIWEAKDKETQEESYLFVPCPLSSITKMMAESVAKNFQMLYDYVYLDGSGSFSDSIMDMLRKFSTDIYTVGLGVNPDDDNVRVPLLVWSSCAYTVMAAEHRLRGTGKPLFGALATCDLDCLTATVRFAAVCNQVFQPDIIKKHCINLLSALLAPPSLRLRETPSLLDFDMFHYLVSVCLALPSLYAEDNTASRPMTHIPSGGLSDHHLLQLTLTAHLVQILLAANFPEQEGMQTEDELDLEGEALAKIFCHVKQQAGLTSVICPTAWQVSTYIREACMPFLRCAALFFHYITGVRTPDSLQERGPDEFEALLDYLALPRHLSKLFSTDHGSILSSLIDSWCSDPAVKKAVATIGNSAGEGPSAGAVVKAACLQYPLAVNRLVVLVSDYSELINKVSTFTCPKSEGEDSRAPTMCLVCGQMLCSQSYCCQTELDGLTVGAATAHAHTCGAGTGIFLRVRECQVLLLSGRTKGCFSAPPYLDDYGETDQGLRRGNPLHLSLENYRILEDLWLSHTIPQSIVHILELNNNLLSIDWQHL